MRINFKQVPTRLEIERRFLLASPPPLATPALVHARPSRIIQTYLNGIPGWRGRSRVRRTQNPDGSITYQWAAKRKMSALTKHESEIEIDERTYNWLLQYKNSEDALVKTRWKFQVDGLTYELDHVREPDEHWLLEVELTREDQEFKLPSFLNIESEVTGLRAS